ncbi:MAG TPA: hypothetical protein VGS02_07140 [Acidobacteriaceae bacterium]|nr:hypothetical protein [Acidobacteriaceae bacterium]
MARIWRESGDGRRFGDRTAEPLPHYARSLIKPDAICVHVCSFTFRFVSKDEIEEYIQFFQAKTHPTSRVPARMLPNCNFRHWHSQRWYERLPLFLQEEPKREKVLKALKEAVVMIEAGKL